MSLLSMRGVHKRFPGVHALKGVSLEVRAGEVHALIGENGAGKSTLMHILAGVVRPDEGSIDFNGQDNISIPDEHCAQRLGIAIVFQERSLFADLSIAENIFAARQPINGWGKIDRDKLFADTRAMLDKVGLQVAPDTPLKDLSAAQQQMVEIAKALSLDAKLIIFDEPTAALTETETQALFDVIEQLKSKCAGIIYISHRLEEIFEIADRVTVLRDGEGQGTFAVSETNPDHLISRMVGRELARAHGGPDARRGTSAPVLEVQNLCESRARLQKISFVAHGGEVLTFAGLAGAGRTELALCLFGARRPDSGEVRIHGRPIRVHSPAEAIAAGIGYLPEDRKEAGLFLDMSVAQNIGAAHLEQFGGFWFSDAEQVGVAEQFRAQLRIASRSVRQSVQSLSGGNQQKVVLAKWLLVNPKVLIVDEPTRGIDVGAKAEVHRLLRELASKGTAVIVISSDLPEVLAVADRILVMREGRINGELAAADATEERVMRFAAMN